MSRTTRRQFFIGSSCMAGAEFISRLTVAGTSGTSESLATDRRDFFYRPRDAWAGDIIPSYFGGEFQLFYLHDWRDAAGHAEGMPWYRISTTDFVHFQEHGEALPRGSKLDRDLYVFTGSVIEAPDGFHIFYTGHNPYLQEQRKPLQAVMHAVSQDLKTWTKRPEHTFFAPTDKYEKDDWRDPFVFWNADTNEYDMLLAARSNEGVPRRRGLTALCTSKDLVKWQVREPFYAPGLYRTHECPDLFKMGDWWYLLFFDDADRRRTRYRMSHSLKGPWITPRRDDLDGCAFAAGKSASDGHRRFLFGTNPTRIGAKDDGLLGWGGNFVVHELVQQADGQLGVRIPASVSKAFRTPAPTLSLTSAGKGQQGDGVLTLDASGSYAAKALGAQPRRCKITARARFDADTREFGLMFRTSRDLDNGYYLRLEPYAQRLVFDMWPRPLTVGPSTISQMVEFERPLQLAAADDVEVTVILDGNMGLAYINDEVAMSFRAYDLPDGGWGFFATGGLVTFSDVSVSTL